MVKQLFLIRLLIVGLSLIGFSSAHPASFVDGIDVALLGELPTYELKSLPQPNPFRATQNQATVDIDAMKNIGVVLISVTNTSGIEVFQTSMDTSVENRKSIDIAGWNSGSYTLCIERPGEENLSGVFEIE